MQARKAFRQIRLVSEGYCLVKTVSAYHSFPPVPAFPLATLYLQHYSKTRLWTVECQVSRISKSRERRYACANRLCVRVFFLHARMRR